MSYCASKKKGTDCLFAGCSDGLRERPISTASRLDPIAVNTRSACGRNSAFKGLFSAIVIDIFDVERVDVTGNVSGPGIEHLSGSRSRRAKIRHPGRYHLPKNCKADIDQKVGATACNSPHPNGWNFMCGEVCVSVAWRNGTGLAILQMIVIRIKRTVETTPISAAGGAGAANATADVCVGKVFWVRFFSSLEQHFSKPHIPLA
jgi:hypothetical protein